MQLFIPTFRLGTDPLGMDLAKRLKRLTRPWVLAEERQTPKQITRSRQKKKNLKVEIVKKQGVAVAGTTEGTGRQNHTRPKKGGSFLTHATERQLPWNMNGR